MLTAAFTVKPPVSQSAMALPSVYYENSLSKYKREEHIYTVYWIMEEHTVLQKYISRGKSRFDQYKQKRVNFSLEQATKAQIGTRCIALFFLQPRS
jgi:hypothetical protein